MAGWETLSSDVVYENKWMRVKEDQVINPAGDETIYGYLEPTSESVIVVPIDERGNMHIVRQYRYPIKQELWEFIAGKIDDGEKPADAAKRECLEEAGIETPELIDLGPVFYAVSLTALRSTVMLAKNVKHVSDELDQDDGIIETKSVPIQTIHDMIVEGKIRSSSSITAFFLATTYLNKEKHD